VVAAVLIVTLGLIGGLAAACCAKAFGIVFLGEPRSREAEGGHEVGAFLLVPEILLAAGCLGMGLLGARIVPAMLPLLRVVSGVSGTEAELALAAIAHPLWGITRGAVVLLGLVGMLGLGRWLLLRGRSVERAGTWDCGYAAPTPHMQYTASSFAQPILDLFRPLLRPHRRVPEIRELHPAAARFSSETHDLFTQRLYRPAVAVVARLFAPLRRLQHGRLHLYVLYIVLALLALAIWKLG
jgi:hypothetical protein